MSQKPLALVTIPRAPRGSKTGWPVVGAQVPPATFSRLVNLAAKHARAKGDLVLEAVEQYLDREAA